MRGPIARFVAAAGVAALAVCGIAAAQEPRAWIKFSSAADGFATEFPGAPTPRDQGAGGTRVRSWEFSDDQGVYAVTITTKSPMTASDYLYVLMGAARRETREKVVARQWDPIKIAGRTASMVTIQVNDTVPDTIIAFDGPSQRMFQLHAPGQPDSPNVVRFRNAFRLQ
jgi:hypothetical protein